MAEAANVLLITADQWRGDALGALGHGVVRTPNLDRLAATGTRFARHFTVTAPCGPARASLHTGLYLHNHRSVMNGTPLDRRHANMALEARQAGLAPTLFGYTDTSPDPEGLAPNDPRLFTYEGVLPGYDVGQALPEDSRPWLAWLRRQGYRGLDTPALAYAPADGRIGGPARFAAAHSETAFIADAALDWLGTRDGRPWFAHVSFLRPHPPWTAPAEFRRLYADGAVGAALPPAPDGLHPLVDGLRARFPVSSLVPGFAGAARDLGAAEAALRATYYALMTEVDHHVGRLLAWLDESGQRERTLVVFTADHGEYLGDHGLYGKMGFHPQAFHIPLIVSAPDAAARGRVVDAFTESVDVMPTVLTALGLETPAACDGAALQPWLRGQEPATWRDAAHWELDFRTLTRGMPGADPDRAALVARLDATSLYVHFAEGPPLFFDLAADPRGHRDLARDATAAGARLAALDALMTWRLRHENRRLSSLRVGPGGLERWAPASAEGPQPRGAMRGV
jgi:arylsulfatase A-like enzyme